ncbi:MAG: lauroyl acyltransferase [Fibrobacter sp.]|nr:lauroyl acyltransferase [Fibrobacter sp.]
MAYAFYKLFLHFALRLPDAFFKVLFFIIFPIYKALHTKRAYGRVVSHLQATGFLSNSTPGRQQINARDVFKSLYWNGIDSYRLLARIPSATLRVRYENEHVIKEALAQGPIVALSIHQGAFENLHRSLCRYSEHVHLITSPFKSTALTRALREIRNDKNLHEYSTEEVATVLRSLFKTNGILAMVVDQARDARGNSVELFGKQSTLYLRLPEKANQMGAGIVTFRTFCETTTDTCGKKFRQHIVRFEKYYPPKYGKSDTLQAEAPLVKEIASEIETWIADHPEQWTWNYHGNFR